MAHSEQAPLLISDPPHNNEGDTLRPPSPLEEGPPPSSLKTELDRRRTTTFEDAPPYLQQNEHIRRFYRQELGSWSECVKSLLWVHNELANIHTHLLPCLFFLTLLSSITLFTLTRTLTPFTLPLPSYFHSPRLDPLSWKTALAPIYPFPAATQPSVTWFDTLVFAALFGGAAVCFGFSAGYHCGLAHSEKVCNRARRADHFGILFHTSVRFIAAFHYGFHCDPHLRNFYVGLMVLACITGVYVIVLSDELQKYEYRKHRTACFFTVGAVAAVPFGHAILRYGYEAASERMAFGWIGVEVACLVAGMVIYSERYPESLFPGKFDLAGNSHNLFHLLAVAAVLAQYAAASEGFRVVHLVASASAAGGGGAGWCSGR
ncbi:hypothetical protein JCM6882_000621 [Rhodosporidiobolus microsporus]